MSQTVREPKQERSIEKKNKIVQAGFELFSQVGYYCTNTAQIAKQAGVSTGIVYGYFKDKRDILLDVLSIYIERVFSPILLMIDKLQAPIDFDRLVSHVLDEGINIHKENAKIHEALHSMSHSDEEVNSKFITLEDDITKRIAQKLQSLGVDCANLLERVHLAMNVVQSFSHEYVYDKHPYICYDDMREIVKKTIIALFVE